MPVSYTHLIALVMVFPVMYTNVLSGIRARDDSLLEMARVFKIPALRRIRCIDLPQVMPYFRAGCTLGLGPVSYTHLDVYKRQT